MRVKLTTGMMDLLMRKTGKSRHIIHATVNGKRVDPDLLDTIQQIIENNKLAVERLQETIRDCM